MTKVPRARRFDFSPDTASDKIHYLFRYPAKFHPPVARELVRRFSEPGQTVLDPFCGSGTLLLEAVRLQRNAIGIDIDPVAAFVSCVKAYPWNAADLVDAQETISLAFERLCRSDADYVRLSLDDISPDELEAVIRDEGLWLPEIPRIQHWFRRYVLVDMARAFALLTGPTVPSALQPFFLLSFASAIRACSNADPVPVSGLEVTAHMRRKDELGRVINPYVLIDRAIRKNVAAIAAARVEAGDLATCAIRQGDARQLATVCPDTFDVCITSPPYHGAVDYYRRHTLEMYWLKFVATQSDRLLLKGQYIGQGTVSQRDARLADLSGTLSKKWEKKIRAISPKRADAFKHYVSSMSTTFGELSRLLPPGGRAVLVVGKSRWNGTELPTTALMADVCEDYFDFVGQYWYPLKNRYMSYARHNGADIDKEFVAVFERRP